MINTHKLNGLKIVLALGVLSVPALGQAAVKPPQFAQCAVCHQSTAQGKSTIGPNLWGLANRKAGTLAGFNYSPALKKAGGAWTKDRLTAYIIDPKKVVPGNRMAFPGQKNPQVAAAIADYILSLK